MSAGSSPNLNMHTGENLSYVTLQIFFAAVNMCSSRVHCGSKLEVWKKPKILSGVKGWLICDLGFFSSAGNSSWDREPFEELCFLFLNGFLSFIFGELISQDTQCKTLQVFFFSLMSLQHLSIITGVDCFHVEGVIHVENSNRNFYAP